MKRNTILLIAAFILLSGALSAGDWSYYRRDGSRRTLTPCESLVTVKFAAETPPLQPSELANSGLLSQDHEVSEIGMGFWLYRLAEGIELDSAIGGLLDYPEIAFVNPVLVADYSRLMFAGDQIILRTQDVVLAAGIHEAFGRLGLQVLVEPDSVTPFYLVALSESSPGTVFDIADSLFETGFCRYSNPNFFGDLAIMHWAPNDTFYPQQWHLNHPADLPGKPGADIDMELAWEIAAGDSTIVVAILDSAFDLDHGDFAYWRILAPYDAGGELWTLNRPDYDPRLPENPLAYWWPFWHGTSCLGLLHAINNNSEGVAAPGSRFYVMPIKIYDDELGFGEASQVRAWAWAVYLDADVISGSLGYAHEFEGVTELIEEAYDRGTAVILAAGNDTTANKPVIYPAMLPHVLAIGATDTNDIVADFSCRGPALDLVAPGTGLYTLDVSGDNGWNRIDSKSVWNRSRLYVFVWRDFRGNPAGLRSSSARPVANAARDPRYGQHRTDLRHLAPFR